MLLSLLLGVESVYVAWVVVVVVVPWDVTFSAFDGRPIGALEAYARATPYVTAVAVTAGAVASLWVRGGRAGRMWVMLTGALHAAAALWFLAQIRTSASGGALFAAAVLVGYAVLLMALAWPGAVRRGAARSSVS